MKNFVLVVGSILVLFGVYEVVQFGIYLMNQPDDVSVFFGFLLSMIPLYLLVVAIGAMVSRWYVNFMNRSE